MVKYTLWGKEVDLDLPKETFPSEDELKHMEEIMPGCEHGWFESRGAQLHYRKFLPSTKPKGVVVYAHGVQSHTGHSFVLSSGRKLGMSLLADSLNKEGYALYAMDMLGHGYSEGHRFYLPHWQVNRDDLDDFAHFAAKQQDEDTPLFLMGESYGGSLCLHVARLWQTNQNNAAPKRFAGVVLIAPAIIGDLPPYPVVFVLRYILAPLFPRWIPFFMPNPVSPHRIWRDDEVLKIQTRPRYKEMGIDGSGRPFCLRTGVMLLNALETVRKQIIPGFTVPFCVCHGTADVGVPMVGTDFLERHSSTPNEDRAILRQEGAYHDMLGDPTAEDNMTFMMQFMNARVMKAST